MDEKIAYVNLKNIVEIIEENDPDLNETFLRLNDSGFNDLKHSQSLSVDELKDLAEFTQKIEYHNVDYDNDEELFEGFVLGYISKVGGLTEQFDVLRFGNKNIFNLELKSEYPKNGTKDIERQLRRHKLYLSTLKPDNIAVCTFVKNSNEFFTIDDNNYFIKIDIKDVTKLLKKTNSENHCFKVIDLSSLIISPYVDPQAFLKHQYFLTQNQYKVRDTILSTKKEKIVIQGSAGSGKTLVLFDLAKKYIKDNLKVVIVFCAPLENDREISNLLNIRISSVRNFNFENIEEDVVMVDESQRLYQNQLNKLLKLKNKKIIWSFDSSQTLHPEEDKLDFKTNIETNASFLFTHLEGKIRYDPVMASFIKKFLENKRARVTPHNYPRVKVHYSSNKKSAKQYITKMDQNGFTCIEPTPYVTKNTGVTERSKISIYSKDVHHVIGREYDNVLFVLDCNYSFDNDGLHGSYPSYYPYKEISEVFESLTRVRNNLMILIVSNTKLYQYTQKILTWKSDTNFQIEKSNKEIGEQVQRLSELIKEDSSGFEDFKEKLEKLAEKFSVKPEAIFKKIMALRKKNKYNILNKN